MGILTINPGPRELLVDRGKTFDTISRCLMTDGLWEKEREEIAQSLLFSPATSLLYSELGRPYSMARVVLVGTSRRGFKPVASLRYSWERRPENVNSWRSEVVLTSGQMPTTSTPGLSHLDVVESGGVTGGAVARDPRQLTRPAKSDLAGRPSSVVWAADGMKTPPVATRRPSARSGAPWWWSRGGMCLRLGQSEGETGNDGIHDELFPLLHQIGCYEREGSNPLLS
ncbi:hypothetical protein GQ53DRAFT_310903 [Thozetella sp. PMI_491]|nr:hypothetical protein GQ53DRAFT_310903 [Thozetella sp. PMI_491]